MRSIMKRPSAWVPIVLSVAMLAFILIYIAMYGVVVPTQNTDEGAPAHLFQIWLIVEFFMVAFFAAKWLPQTPKQALSVLTIQIVAVLMVCFPVFYFKL